MCLLSTSKSPLMRRRQRKMLLRVGKKPPPPAAFHRLLLVSCDRAANLNSCRESAKLAEAFDQAMCLDAATARAQTRARDQQIQAYQLAQHCQDSTWDLNRPDRLKLQQPSRFVSINFPACEERRYTVQDRTCNEHIGRASSWSEAVRQHTASVHVWQGPLDMPRKVHIDVSALSRAMIGAREDVDDASSYRCFEERM